MELSRAGKSKLQQVSALMNLNKKRKEIAVIENKKEQSINGWYIPLSPYEGRDYKFKPLSEYNNSYTFKVYLCPDCKRAHETVWEYGAGNQTYFYDDFPTIGLHRKECIYCND